MFYNYDSILLSLRSFSSIMVPFLGVSIDMTIMMCGQSRYGITTDRCRMDMLMDYFGEELEGGRCKKYDNKLAQMMASFKHNCNIA